VDGFPGEKGGMVNIGGNFGFGQEAKLTVVDKGCGCAVYFDGYGEDAGFFEGGVFSLDHPHPQPLSQGERGAQGEDEVLGGGGVFPGAIFVFLGREIGGGEVEVAFGVNKADFVSELGGEFLCGFVPGGLADEVAGILSIPGDAPALAGEHLLDFSSRAEGFEGGLRNFGGGDGGGDGWRRGEGEGGRGGGRLSAVRLRSAVGGLRSARGEEEAEGQEQGEGPNEAGHGEEAIVFPIHHG